MVAFDRHTQSIEEEVMADFVSCLSDLKYANKLDSGYFGVFLSWR